MSSKAKGTRAERELLHAFRDEGWFAIRSPGSSGGYDLIAAKDGHVIVIELKYVEAGETVYFTKAELYGGEERKQDDGGIVGVAEDFGGYAYAVVRWKRDTTFYGLPPDLLRRANSDDSGRPLMKPADTDEALELPPADGPEQTVETARDNPSM